MRAAPFSAEARAPKNPARGEYAMRIAGFQKLTLLDFPGKVACTLFTPGCNFRCPFCHNASLVLSPEDADEFSEEEILSFLKKRRGLLEGVAITGGEPLLQPGIDGLIRKIRALGYAVKLDTNGSFPEKLAALLEEGLLDYAAMDIKNSPERYDLAAGVRTDMEKIRRSVSLLTGGKIPYEFRTTVVKGIHRREDFPGIGRLIEGAERYFIQSYVDSGDVIDPRFEAFTPEELGGFLDAVRPFVASVALRGV